MLASKQRILWTIPRDPKFSWIVPLDSRNRRSWGVMRDHELVRFARKFLEEEGIGSRGKLVKVDPNLYQVLKKKKLLDKVEFEDKKRDWKSMSDEEIVEYVKRFMEEKEINGRKDLWKADSGSYTVLWKRKLLDRIEFERKRRKTRNWKTVSDNELVEYVKEFIEKEGISKREELKKLDYGLYSALWRRKLLDQAFAPIEQSGRKEAILQVVEAMEEFAC
ncbi:hypothetical protein KKB44_06265 [Candidatus Micrarchaeota archaeon]|nr:hypothetical protein [Candidatus Micrarchaeota archaeon]